MGVCQVTQVNMLALRFSPKSFVRPVQLSRTTRFYSEAPPTSVFLGNIAWSASVDDIREHFSQFGHVESVRIITDRDTGRSKGFGFVNFAEPSGATAAVAALDGTDFLGRTINVGLGRSQNRPGSGFQRRDQTVNE